MILLLLLLLRWTRKSKMDFYSSSSWVFFFLGETKTYVYPRRYKKLPASEREAKEKSIKLFFVIFSVLSVCLLMSEKWRSLSSFSYSISSSNNCNVHMTLEVKKGKNCVYLLWIYVQRLKINNSVSCIGKIKSMMHNMLYLEINFQGFCVMLLLWLISWNLFIFYSSPPRRSINSQFLWLLEIRWVQSLASFTEILSDFMLHLMSWRRNFLTNWLKCTNYALRS